MVQPFPSGMRIEEIETGGATIHTRVGGTGTRGRHAARLRRHRRHVGAAAASADARSHGGRARPARHGPVVPSGRRLRQEDPGATTSRACSTRSSIDKAELVTHDIGNMVGYAFAAQFPRAGDALGGDGCAAARHRAMGRDPARARCCGTSISAVPTWSGWSPGRERIYLDRF